MGPGVDPVSGKPEFKNTPARVEPFVVNWYGFAMTRGSLSVASPSWWVCAEGGDDRLEACMFVGPQPQLVSRSWLASLIEKPRLTASDRARILAGRPEDPRLDTGITVCACFGVGRNAIEQAVADGCHDLSSIGQRLKAGTNCGSCLPELRGFIANAAARSAFAH